jgi:hypothetical protein
LSVVEVMSPPRMTTAIGCSISRPGSVPATSRGTRANPCRGGRHENRRDAFASPADHQVEPERHAFFAFQMLVVADQHDAVPGHDPEHGEEARRWNRAR